MTVRLAVALALAAALAAGAYAAYENVEDPASTFFGRTFTGIPPGHRVVALTFDDGPNGASTAAILDVLRREGVRATFFVVGNAVAREPELARRIAREGHALGNHTWDHAHLNVLNRKGIDDELLRTQQALLAATGTGTTLARPPFGARSFLALDELKRLGYTCVLWSVPLARDWEAVDGATIARRVLTRASDGTIIVLHDGDRGRPANREGIAEATRLIVEGLRARGLSFVTVPQMLAIGGER